MYWTSTMNSGQWRMATQGSFCRRRASNCDHGARSLLHSMRYRVYARFLRHLEKRLLIELHHGSRCRALIYLDLTVTCFAQILGSPYKTCEPARKLDYMVQVYLKITPKEAMLEVEVIWDRFEAIYDAWMASCPPGSARARVQRHQSRSELVLL
jgi:hypothetical protein